MVFLKNPLQFVADAVGGQRRYVPLGDGAPELAEGLFFNTEAKPFLVADGAKNPGWIVHKAVGVERANEAAAQVLDAAVEVEDLRAAVCQGQGQGVDGEVAAVEVVCDAPWRYVGESRGMGIGLPPGGDHVDAYALQRYRGGAEPGVDNDLTAKLNGHFPSHLGTVALDHEVQIADRPAQEDVANGAAHEVC